MNCFLEIQKKKEEFRKLLKVFLSLGISYTFIIQKWVPVDLLEVVEEKCSEEQSGLLEELMSNALTFMRFFAGMQTLGR